MKYQCATMLPFAVAIVGPFENQKVHIMNVWISDPQCNSNCLLHYLSSCSSIGRANTSPRFKKYQTFKFNNDNLKSWPILQRKKQSVLELQNGASFYSDCWILRCLICWPDVSEAAVWPGPGRAEVVGIDVQLEVRVVFVLKSKEKLSARKTVVMETFHNFMKSNTWSRMFMLLNTELV